MYHACIRALNHTYHLAWGMCLANSIVMKGFCKWWKEGVNCGVVCGRGLKVSDSLSSVVTKGVHAQLSWFRVIGSAQENFRYGDLRTLKCNKTSPQNQIWDPHWECETSIENVRPPLRMWDPHWECETPQHVRPPLENVDRSTQIPKSKSNREWWTDLSPGKATGRSSGLTKLVGAFHCHDVGMKS